MESLLYNKPSCAVDILKNHHLPFKNIKYQKHYEFILLFHASEHDRNAK